MIKRITAVLLAVTACICCLTSCGQLEHNTVLRVSGAEISGEIIAYYFGAVLHNRALYGLTEESTYSEISDCAVNLCIDYVAVNSTFENCGLRLTPEYKYDIAETVSSKWDFYEKFYTAVGISKQTITKIETADAKKSMLFLYYYGEGGERDVPDDALKAYFEENYVSFKVINGYLTEKDENGNIVPISDEQKHSLETKFKNMLDDIRTGSPIDEVSRKYATDQKLSSYSSDLMTINKDNNTYPNGFFSYVSKMQPNGVSIIETSDYIFLVVRITSSDDELLEQYRTSCLRAMCDDDFKELLSSIKSTYETDRDSSSIREIYNIVSDEF